MTRAIILAFALLVTPAHAGKTDMAKQPACVPGAPVKIVTVRGEPDLVFVPVPFNWFYAREILKPCKTPGLIRSKHDAKCYRKERLP